MGNGVYVPLLLNPKTGTPRSLPAALALPAVCFLSCRLYFIQSFFLSRNIKSFPEIMHFLFQSILLTFLLSGSLAFIQSCASSSSPVTLIS